MEKRELLAGGMHRAEFKSSKAMRKTIYLSPPKRYKRSAVEYSLPDKNFFKMILVQC